MCGYGEPLTTRRIACGILLAAVAAAASGQQDPAQIVQLDKVEVTGSNIARIDGESGLPVQIITREVLLDGGVQTMQDLLQRISANQSYGGFNEAKGENTTLVGFTGASLRGLGTQRTLILLNGRRLAPYALSNGQSVDLSGIPASALERVEILKDGASAVYGTDAIGGVINFILRKDYQGAEVNANYFGTQEGGGNNGRISFTAGHGDLAADKFNVFLSADYYKQDALKATQRNSTRTGYIPGLGLDQTSVRSIPANILQTDPFSGDVYGFGGTRNPTVPFPGGAIPTSCTPPYSFTTRNNPYQCRFDFAVTSDTIPEVEKFNVIGRFAWQLAPEHQLFVEADYYRGQFTQRSAPSPLHSILPSEPMTLPPSSPYYPTSFVAGLPGGDPTQPLELQYRTVELGQRTYDANTDQWNAVIGAKGLIAGWDYQLVATYTENRQVSDYVSGFVYESKFSPLLRSGVVNPFGTNTPAVLDLMRATQVTGQANDNRATNYGAALQFGNEVYELPAGPLAVAFGLEGRRESLQQSNSDFTVSGDVAGSIGAVPSLPSVYRTVWSLYGEVNIPIVKSLEANVALRYDHYSDFGGATNPKVTLRWQPMREVVVRGAWGTGFRAPTLSDVYQPQSTYIDPEGYQDPIRCPITGSFYDCDRGVNVTTGGNPALQPETSQQVNAGIVVQPTRQLSASVDYYWVKVKNVIQTLPLDTILGDDYAQWTHYVVRHPPDAQYPNLPGPIEYVVQYPTNVGTITTSGIDVGVQWNGPDTPIGRFSANLNGTYVLDYSSSGFLTDELPSAGFRALQDTAISRYRQYAQLNWTKGGWGTTLANTYQSGYDEPCWSSDPSGCDTRRVGSYSVWDIQGRYTGIKDLSLSLGVRNMMNTQPPLTNQISTNQVGIDPAYADPRGRMFYGMVRYKFW